jgi:C4-dicarboxylate transporter, DctQ subunit
MMRRLAAWLHRRAENVAALMLAVMFSAFVVQIVFRYVFNFPVGWTSELTVALWLWLVLWGAAFVIRESGEIRFDLIVGAVGRRMRVAMGIVAAIALLVLYAASLPASWSYVTFMQVEKSSYLKVPMNWMFSIYIVFLIAVLARYLWLLWYLIRGEEVDQADPTQASSGL